MSAASGLLAPLLGGLAEAGFVGAVWSLEAGPNRLYLEELWLPSLSDGPMAARSGPRSRTLRPRRAVRGGLRDLYLAMVGGEVVRGPTPWSVWLEATAGHERALVEPWGANPRFEICAHLPLTPGGRPIGALTLSRASLSEAELLLVRSLVDRLLAVPPGQRPGHPRRALAAVWSGRETMLEEALQPLTALQARLEVVNDLLHDGQFAELQAQLVGLHRSIERLAGQVGQLTGSRSQSRRHIPPS